VIVFAAFARAARRPLFFPWFILGDTLRAVKPLVWQTETETETEKTMVEGVGIKFRAGSTPVLCFDEVTWG
jgi:hypothetical protein